MTRRITGTDLLRAALGHPVPADVDKRTIPAALKATDEPPEVQVEQQHGTPDAKAGTGPTGPVEPTPGELLARSIGY